MLANIGILVLAMISLTQAQQVRIGTTSSNPRPSCTKAGSPSPSFTFGNFSFTLSDTLRTAFSVHPIATTTYAAPPSILTSLLPSISYTTWGSWNPHATVTASDTLNPYGDAAWTALWEFANPPNFTTETSIYSSTVSPTPISPRELILPPRDYFTPTDCYDFPENFMFGVSSASSQIEGAVAQEGKSPNLMDILIQDDQAKNYVTNENYYLYKQDIVRLASIGVRYYAFSLTWSRILPFALPDTPVNQQGLDHYDDLINFVIEQNMIPVITLIHYDTPIQFYGSNLSSAADPPLIGYHNGAYQNETFVDAFVNYAKIVMAHYADRVPIWFTFNEPFFYSFNGVSIDHVIKAHARVYHYYKDVLNGTGQISLKLSDDFGVPRNISNNADVFAANHFNSFQLATFCNPIFLGQDYPDAFKQTLPDYISLTPEDLEYIGGTADFLGIDPYTANVITPPIPNKISSILECTSNTSHPNYPYCVVQSHENEYGWNIGYRSQSYLYITPTYLREYLKYLYNTFYSPIVITEFGYPVFGEADKTDLSDQLFDTPRSIYYLSFLSETLKAIWEDGVDVRGVFAWSFADNW